MECSLSRWIKQNSIETRENCRKLLTEIKRQHLDPALTRLVAPDGYKVSFMEIKECYSAIENDFKAEAKGAKDACAEMFVEFHAVGNPAYFESKITCYKRHYFVLIYL